jgi:hypothetical protein
MKVVIQIAASDKVKAWGLLVRHSPGTALPNRTFIVSEEAVRALRAVGIKFTEISREPGEPTTQRTLGRIVEQEAEVL